MSLETNDNEDEIEKLRIENEIKKIKLTLEYGATFSKPSENSELNPHIEAQFLDNIEQFEKAYNNCKQISIYDFIGKPEFRKTDDIPNEEINAELGKMINLMNESGIYLDTLCEVEDPVLYRFITEELFLHETDDVRIEGMSYNFIYEEFHPNHEYDIRNHSLEFINSFLDKENDFYTYMLTKEAENNIELKNFRDAFTSFSLHHFEIQEINFDEEKAKVIFEINFSGAIEGSGEIQIYSGEGNIELLNTYDYWSIHKVKFPS